MEGREERALFHGPRKGKAMSFTRRSQAYGILIEKPLDWRLFNKISKNAAWRKRLWH
jgi:hypothetical protein